MVHTFKALDRYFAVDTYSGSVFEVDSLTKSIIDARQQVIVSGENSFDVDKTGEEFLGYSSEEFDAASTQINTLIREHALFTPAPRRTMPDFNGIVKAMCLNITHVCEMACAYCFAKGGGYGAQTLKHMTLSTAKNAMDFLIRKSGSVYNLEVDFFGGEPLLNIDVIKKAVEYARSREELYNKRFRFCLTTGALNLTDDIINFLNKEMDNVIISIDGRENVHNSLRKTKSGLDTWVEAVEKAKRFVAVRGNKSYFVRGTFTANNLDFTNDVLALYKEGFINISLEPVVLPDKHPLAIRQRYVRQICTEYEKLAKKYLKYRARGDWFTFFHFNLNLYNSPCEAKLLRACGAGCDYVAVDPSGNIYPCHQYVGKPAFSFGNVNTKDYNKNIPLNFARKNHALAKEKCRDCWAQYYCGGGCAANATGKNGTISAPHELSCTLTKKRIECALAVWAIENE